MSEVTRSEEEKEKDELKERVKRLDTTLGKLASYLERINLGEYLTLLQSPRRLLYLNLVSGIARGFGMAIGMTLIFGVFLYILGKMVDIPLIGAYLAKIVKIVTMELKK